MSMSQTLLTGGTRLRVSTASAVLLICTTANYQYFSAYLYLTSV